MAKAQKNYTLTLKIINAYGGAVTSKNLTSLSAYSFIDAQGFIERFSALAISPNATDLIGYYEYVHLRFISIGLYR
ncbi:hypothetical protein [Vulcanisaeta thermophila]|uniref:hypothetical protein n=1 Tax=Vulcanisaeta thermophila TaxID=867917 RepID=UPI000852CAF0|nr:hypothetical protein [Vulcanisaeta thermophila]